MPLGFVLAKVIVTVDVSKEAISAMRERALKAKHMESMTRKITLHPDDLARAEQMPVKAISVIPTVNLDEATVIQRFGQPGERLVVSENGPICSTRRKAGCRGRWRRQGAAAICCAEKFCQLARAFAGTGKCQNCQPVSRVFPLLIC